MKDSPCYIVQKQFPKATVINDKPGKQHFVIKSNDDSYVPILGQGSSRKSAWKSAARNIEGRY